METVFIFLIFYCVLRFFIEAVQILIDKAEDDE